MLRGAGDAVSYVRPVAGSGLIAGAKSRLLPGMVDAVSPRIGDIHTVANALADQPSISIHLYGRNIGTVHRHSFDPETGAASGFVSGYSASVVPNLWT